MLLIVSVRSREETVPCNYYADTKENTARLTSGVQGIEREEA
jgi:hypothetical protein